MFTAFGPEGLTSEVAAMAPCSASFLTMPEFPSLSGASLSGSARGLMVAALALPGLLVATAVPVMAQTAPDSTVVALKYMDYLDFEKDRQRVHIRVPALYIQKPVTEDVALEITGIGDAVSGASPFPIIPGAAVGPSGRSVTVSDRRHAVDGTLTKYFHRGSVGFSASMSREHDWTSTATGVEARISTEDNLTTFALGTDLTLDTIKSPFDPTFRGNRHTINTLFGVTQVLTPLSLVMLNVTFGTGQGTYRDIYRPADQRPSHRNQWAGLVRYNHFVPGLDAALHFDYRLYRDDWNITAHTLEAAWYQPFGEGWMLRPRVRYYSQNAARFYTPGTDDRLDFVDPISTDYRLAAFGALGVGAKLSKEITETLTADAAFDWYAQRSGWKLGGGGTRTLAPLNARTFTVGLTKLF